MLFFHSSRTNCIYSVDWHVPQGAGLLDRLGIDIGRSPVQIPDRHVKITSAEMPLSKELNPVHEMFYEICTVWL